VQGNKDLLEELGLKKPKMQTHQLKHHVCGIHFGYAKT